MRTSSDHTCFRADRVGRLSSLNAPSRSQTTLVRSTVIVQSYPRYFIRSQAPLLTAVLGHRQQCRAGLQNAAPINTGTSQVCTPSSLSRAYCEPLVSYHQPHLGLPSRTRLYRGSPEPYGTSSVKTTLPHSTKCGSIHEHAQQPVSSCIEERIRAEPMQPQFQRAYDPALLYSCRLKVWRTTLGKVQNMKYNGCNTKQNGEVISLIVPQILRIFVCSVLFSTFSPRL